MQNLENLLTHNDYVSILQEKLQTLSFELQEAKWTPLSENVQGFLGEHYILTLKYSLNHCSQEEKFFIKTKPRSNLSQLKVTEDLSLFQKESLIFMKVFKKFEEIGYLMDFAPKCYFAKNNETLVFEDLRSKGYNLIEQNFLEMNQCKAVLKAIARLHANSLAFEEKRSLELNRTFRLGAEYPEAFKEIFYNESRKELDLEFDVSTSKCLMKLANLLPEIPEWKEEFYKKVSNFNTYEVFAQQLPYRKACGHGDLWIKNMLFKKSGDEVQCVLVDFQVIRHHHPSVDALLLLYLTTSNLFRRRHKEELMDFHYAEMRSVLFSYGFNLEEILPKKHYLDSALVFEPIAAFQGAGNRSITFLSPELITKVVKSSGGEFKDLLFSDLRATLAAEAFRSDENYRKALTEDIYELYKLL